MGSGRRVALLTLGCARNEVDSEELAGRLEQGGFVLVDDPDQADTVVVNTCGFVESAKKDSVDTLLEAADLKASGRTQAVVAVGCLAERYGRTLAEELPDADAVLGFDSYADMSTHLRSVLDGHPPAAHVPADRRRLLPLAKEHKVPNLICFSGSRREMPDEQAWDNCALLLNKVKAQAEDLGVTIVMELLNSKVNHPDYQCDKTPWGVELCKRVDSPRFKLLYDIYHMQIMEGDVIRTIKDNAQYLAHYHTGGNPGRNEIDETQELNYKAISQAVVDLGFSGYYAHEFIPKRDPMTSLREAVALCDV